MFGFVWYEIMLAIALFIASILYFIMAFMCKDNLITEDQNGNKYDKDGSPIAVGEGASNPPANQPAQQPAPVNNPAPVANPANPSPRNLAEGAFAPVVAEQSAPE